MTHLNDLSDVELLERWEATRNYCVDQGHRLRLEAPCDPCIVRWFKHDRTWSEA